MASDVNAVPLAEAPNAPSAVDTVKAFLTALEQLDLDKAVSLVADDVRWVNAPIKSASNKEQFDKALRSMFKSLTRFEVRYRDIHERDNGIVYTDRLDIAEGGGLQMDLEVRGEFKVEHGLIVRWVDRFSWSKLLSELIKSAPSMIVHRLRR